MVAMEGTRETPPPGGDNGSQSPAAEEAGTAGYTGAAPGAPLAGAPSPSKMAGYPTDLTLRLLAVRTRSGQPDPQLQGVLRRRLRLLEGDSREVALALGELSARLLSIHSDQDRLVVSFKTFEEVRKFSIYHDLGLTHSCLEGLLVDEAFWLEPLQGAETAAIRVLVDQEALRLMQESLLVQDGSYFLLTADHQVRLAAGPLGTDVAFRDPRRTVGAAQGDETPPAAAQPPSPCTPPEEAPRLLAPFHQWALRGPWDPLEDLLGEPEAPGTLELAVGLATALTDCQASAPEDVSFWAGDQLELLGVQVPGLAWCLCRHTASGQVGFARTSDFRAQSLMTAPHEDIFLSEEEHCFFSKEASFTQEDAQRLLARTSGEVTSLQYTLDRLELGETEPQEEQETPPAGLHPDPQETLQRVRTVLERCQSRWTRPEEPEPWGLPPAPAPSSPDAEEPPFRLDAEADWTSPEALGPLDAPGCLAGFRGLYALCPRALGAAFPGLDDRRLAEALARARVTAKRAGLGMARARLCFLLGALCLRGLKLSQARVYLDEALAALAGRPGDPGLLAAAYAGLAWVLLRQRNAARCARVLPKAWALLLGLPGLRGWPAPRAPLLALALRAAVAAGSRWAETRACFLLAAHHLDAGQPERARPFLERLVLLVPVGDPPWTAGAFLLLAATYGHESLPRLALACLRADSLRAPRPLPAALRGLALALEHGPPAHAAPFLREALDAGPGRPLTGALCASLARLHAQHGQLGRAVAFTVRAAEAETSVRRTVDHLTALAQLLVLSGRSPGALDILEAVLEAAVASEDQEGVVANMLGIALARTGRTQRAAESYYRALRAAQTQGRRREQAVVLANLGALYERGGAIRLGAHCLQEAVWRFSRLPGAGGGPDFSHVLLRLGRLLARRGLVRRAQCYHEWALLVALDSGHLHSQLQMVQALSHFHSAVRPDATQNLVCLEFQLALAGRLGDKALEARLLGAIGQLYLALGTQRAFRAALDYTKRGLAVSIDLRDRAQEARGWLTAGRLYYGLRQGELVDLYLQVAQDAALSTADAHLALEVFEAAGDIFFNGRWEREKAASFYRDRALPLAVSTGSREAELRLCNKLAALLAELDTPREGLEFAHGALALSVSLGHQLNERVACHRLGTLHRRLGEAELAEHFLLRALALGSWPLQPPEDSLYYLRAYRVLGDLIFHELKDPLDAAGYYQLALAAAVDLGSKRAQEQLCWRLAAVHHHFLGDRAASLAFYRQARAFASELRERRVCGRAPWTVPGPPP